MTAGRPPKRAVWSTTVAPCELCGETRRAKLSPDIRKRSRREQGDGERPSTQAVPDRPGETTDWVPGASTVERERSCRRAASAAVPGRSFRQWHRHICDRELSELDGAGEQKIVCEESSASELMPGPGMKSEKVMPSPAGVAWSGAGGCALRPDDPGMRAATVDSRRR